MCGMTAAEIERERLAALRRAERDEEAARRTEARAAAARATARKLEEAAKDPANEPVPLEGVPVDFIGIRSRVTA